MSINLFINGINTGPSEILANHKNIQSIIGEKYHLVYNQSEGTTFDLKNASLGLKSDIQGIKAEENVFKKLISYFLTALMTKRNIRIYAHSQGSIILKNTLMVIKELNISFWKKLLPRLKIITLGAANHLWPKDLSVTSIADQNDLIANTSYNLSKKLRKDNDLQLVRPRFVDTGKSKHLFEKHSIEHYMRIFKDLK